MPNPLYPNLPSGIPPEVQQPRARNAAEGCWPAWSREAKAKDRDQQLWNEIVKRNRDNFLREWRKR
jgi:hypothetical protein